MSLEFILIYSATVFMASITPGPSMLLALNHGVKYGAGRTVASALGNVAATSIQASLSMAGLGAILLRSEAAFSTVKYLGAGYLILMGIRMLFSSTSGPKVETRELPDRKGRGSLFTEAFIVTMGNPKAVLFFTALFPQFVNTRSATFFQFFTILSVLLLTTFVCMMIYASFGHRIARGLQRPRLRKLCNRIVGGSFIGMGIGLATGARPE